MKPLSERKLWTLKVELFFLQKVFIPILKFIQKEFGIRL